MSKFVRKGVLAADFKVQNLPRMCLQGILSSCKENVMYIVIMLNFSLKIPFIDLKCVR